MFLYLSSASLTWSLKALLCSSVLLSSFSVLSMLTSDEQTLCVRLVFYSSWWSCKYLYSPGILEFLQGMIPYLAIESVKQWFIWSKAFQRIVSANGVINEKQRETIKSWKRRSRFSVPSLINCLLSCHGWPLQFNNNRRKMSSHWKKCPLRSPCETRGFPNPDYYYISLL